MNDNACGKDKRPVEERSMNRERENNGKENISENITFENSDEHVQFELDTFIIREFHFDVPKKKRPAKLIKDMVGIRKLQRNTGYDRYPASNEMDKNHNKDDRTARVKSALCTSNNVPESEEHADMPETLSNPINAGIDSKLRKLKLLLVSAATQYAREHWASAIADYRSAYDIITNEGIQAYEKEIDQNVVCYALCICLLKTDQLNNLIEAVQLLVALENRSSFEFPAVYYALCVAHCKNYRFELADKAAQRGFDFLNSNSDFNEYTFPGTHIVIPETTKVGLSLALAKMKDECSQWHCPDAVCSLTECVSNSVYYSPSRKIFFSDPAFNGMVTVICNNAWNPCTINFHQTCWRFKKDQISPVTKLSDKDIIGLECFTPNCESSKDNPNVITQINIIGENGELKTQIEAPSNPVIRNKRPAVTKGAIPKQPITPKKTSKRPRKSKIIPPTQTVSFPKEPSNDGAAEMGWRLALLKELRRNNFGVSDDDQWRPDRSMYGNPQMMEVHEFLDCPIARNDSNNVSEVESFIFSYFYEFINDNLFVESVDILRQWEHNKEAFVAPDSGYVINIDICEFLVGSQKIARLEDYFCVAEYLPELYAHVKDELRTCLNFVLCDSPVSNIASLKDEVPNEITSLSRNAILRSPTNGTDDAGTDRTNVLQNHTYSAVDIASGTLNGTVESLFEPVEERVEITCPDDRHSESDDSMRRSQSECPSSNSVETVAEQPNTEPKKNTTDEIESDESEPEHSDAESLEVDVVESMKVELESVATNGPIGASTFMKNLKENVGLLPQLLTELSRHQKAQDMMVKAKSIWEKERKTTLKSLCSVKQEVQRLVTELRDIRVELDTTQQSRNAVTAEKVQLEFNFKKITKEYEELKTAHNMMEFANRSLNTTVASLQLEQQDLEARLADTRKLLQEERKKNMEFVPKQSRLEEENVNHVRELNEARDSAKRALKLSEIHHQYEVNEMKCKYSRDRCCMNVESLYGMARIVMLLTKVPLNVLEFDISSKRTSCSVNKMIESNKSVYQQLKQILESEAPIPNIDELKLPILNFEVPQVYRIEDIFYKLYPKHLLPCGSLGQQGILMAGNPPDKRYSSPNYPNHMQHMQPHPLWNLHGQPNPHLVPPPSSMFMPRLPNPHFPPQYNGPFPKFNPTEHHRHGNQTNHVNCNPPNNNANGDFVNGNGQQDRTDHEKSSKSSSENCTNSPSEETNSSETSPIRGAAKKLEPPRTHGLDNLLEILREKFIGMPEHDLIESVQDLRSSRHGSISGVTIEEIVRKVDMFLKSRQLNYFTFPAPGETVQPRASKSASSNVTMTNAANKPIPKLMEMDLKVKLRPTAGRSGPTSVTSNKPAWAPVTNKLVEWTKCEEEAECAICCEIMVKRDAIFPLYTLPCKHTFHTSCIKKWLPQNSVCPICRSHCTMDDEFPPLP